MSDTNRPDDPRKDAFRSLFRTFEEHPKPKPGGEQFGLAAAQPQRKPQFRFFQADDQQEAQKLSKEFDELAGPNPTDDDLRRVMDRFHEVAEKNSGLAKWALRFFIARRPGADVLPMPTLRQQLAAEPPDTRQSALRLSAVQPRPVPSGGVAVVEAPTESAMNYFRHDLDLSDHHLHWHILYPWSNPNGGAGRRPGLSGRLFLYMHQQCLARYDTERTAAGLDLVKPLIAWDDAAGAAVYDDTALPVDPLAPWIPTESGEGTFVAFDLGGQSPRDLAASAVQAVIDNVTQLRADITGGTYPKDETGTDNLGSDIECSSARFVPGPHNNGHVMVSYTPQTQGRNGPYTVMIDPSVAMTTPIFYQWHRAVDDIGYNWQELQGPDAWNYKTPPVHMRRALQGAAGTASPDVILTLRSAIPGIDGPGFDLQAWAAQQFGGAKFDQPADASLNADTLHTAMKFDPLMQEDRLDLVDHWVYSIRLNNPAPQPAAVTVRIFLAAEKLAGSRRHWIEMDKSVVSVPANTKLVYARPGWSSTVVRAKSVADALQLASQDDQYVNDPNQPMGSMWCECGLPYRLLLPKGTSDGMAFRFMVMLTDAVEDGLVDDPQFDVECGSVSFCGRNNFQWPDGKPMGFPFHRPFPPATPDPLSFFENKTNVVWRDVTITNGGA